MTATHLTADSSVTANGGTVHVIATSLEGTREALEAATALARGLCGRVVVFLRRASTDINVSDQNVNNNETEQALRRLTDSYTPRPNVLSCVCKRAIDVIQLFQSPGIVVIGGRARWWWPLPSNGWRKISRGSAVMSRSCTCLGVDSFRRWLQRRANGRGRRRRGDELHMAHPVEVTPPNAAKRTAPNILIATTAMLAFISFWRAAAVVLNDMGSSAFYAGAIAEHFIGKSAPWFILAIMVLAYAVRAVYIESCSMFVRGGVYRVVKEAMGSTLAKFSVSALMFDYILTGPISGVSAGLYLTGLLNELLGYAHATFTLPMNATAAFFAIVVTLFFWWENIKGIPESSEKALRIMYVTTIMVVMMIAWCGYTLAVRGGHLPPLPRLSTITYSDDAVGWLRYTRLPYTVAFVAILIGLGHSVLAMSGEETMAQVYREIEHPKLKNLEKAGFVIFVYSLIFTAGTAFFVVMIIPDAVRGTFFDNPIGGLAMHLAGPLPLRIAFRAFFAVVGTLIWPARDTSIVG